MTVAEAFRRIEKASAEHLREQPPKSYAEAREHHQVVAKAKDAALGHLLRQERLAR